MVNKQLFINLINNKTDIINVSDLITINELKKLIIDKYHYDDDIYLKGIHLLKLDSTIEENKINNGDTIFVNCKIKGGFIDLLINLLTGMVKLLKNVGSIVEDLIGIIVNTVEMIPAIFSPDKLINDIIFGISLGINSLFEGLLKNLTFKVPNDKPDAGMLFGMDSRAKKVCVAPTFLNLIILVLCPPLALFIDRGIRGIFLVIICCLMTYFLYYFPGLIFAALHILC